MLEDKLVTTNDGSHTLFSLKYNQHFHNTEDGAINEALSKHIIPTFFYHQNKKELNILDICFGIGFFKPFLIRFEVYKSQVILWFDIGEKFSVAVFIENDVKIFFTADAVMVFAFRTNKLVLCQFWNGTGVLTVRAFGP